MGLSEGGLSYLPPENEGLFWNSQNLGRAIERMGGYFAKGLFCQGAILDGWTLTVRTVRTYIKKIVNGSTYLLVSVVNQKWCSKFSWTHKTNFSDS